MVAQIQLGDITVDVTRKNIKNIHLSVYPPTGAVRISAPTRMGLPIIRIFVLSKLGWIKKQQLKLRSQDREPPREYIDRESHLVWGKRYLLKVIEADGAPSVCLEHNQMTLRVRPGSTLHRKQEIVEEWHRDLVRDALLELIAKWEPILGVKVRGCTVRKMKTRWGSCTPRGKIILNPELVKAPKGCIEYVIIHELCHLIHHDHTQKFIDLQTKEMPDWEKWKMKLEKLLA